MMASNKKDDIKNTFIAMIKRTPIEALKTEDLIRQAGVSKATFYRLFKDKYDVMNSVYLDFSHPVVHSAPSLHNWKQWTILDMENVRKHKAFFRNIISYTGQNSLHDSLREFYGENIMREVRNQIPEHEITKALLFSVDVMIETAVYTMIWWIKHDCQVDPEVMIEQIEAHVPDKMKRFYSPESGEKP